jgi:hypothetical protein
VYGVGCAEQKDRSRQAGKRAITNALQNAHVQNAHVQNAHVQNAHVQNARVNTSPALVWITCAPGDEEEILAGIEAGLGGKNAPIIGGSSADNTVEGKWYQVTNGQVLHDGVAVTAMYPSKPVCYAFDNSYTPTQHSGVITKASGRTIYTINHRPAAEVYNEWTNGAISAYLEGGNILAPSTLYPLGRAATWGIGTTLYQLSHPEAVLENRALALFTRAEPGEEIVLMESSAQDLIYRVDRITSKALSGIHAPDKQIAGALVIYCAGCMLAVQSEMQKVAEQFHEALGGQPFLGLYTFGEQGCALLGENSHANLMMSIVVFEK